MPTIDRSGGGTGEPWVDAFTITPDDNADLSIVPRCLLIGTAGDVKVTTLVGTVIILPLPAGYNPGRVKRVWATGTTASGVYGLL